MSNTSWQCDLWFGHSRATAVALMASLTGAISLVPVIAMASFMATFVGDMFGMGIYDAYLADRNMPLLADPESEAATAIVSDRCCHCLIDMIT